MDPPELYWITINVVRIIVYYHLYITDECNLSCRYCRERIFQVPAIERPELSIKDIPTDVTYSLTDLYRFFSGDPNAVITFIGGEPTMRPEFITQVMQTIPAKKWMIQTNGILLHQFPSDIINRFSTILVSIDGNKEITDYNRGRGTYSKIIENLQTILANGFQGELIARITVTEETDIYDAVTHLASNNGHSFHSIHWQIDAGFWNDYHLRSFGSWAVTKYIPGLQALADVWIRTIEQEKIVPHWYPFIGIIRDLITEEDSLLRCGSGHSNYTIQTDGTIIPCPIMLGIQDYYLGHIRDTSPPDIPTVVIPSERCHTCDIFPICGGRCLYSAVMNPWPIEGMEEICFTVRSYISILQGILFRINKLIEEESLDSDAFMYERFNGCEIIP